MGADIALLLLYPPLGSLFPPGRYSTQYHFLAHLERKIINQLAGEINTLMTTLNASSLDTGLNGTGKAIAKGTI